MQDEGPRVAEIINLNTTRKRKSREEKAKTAGENRVKFGRTKSQKQAARLEEQRRMSKIEGAKLDHDKD